MADAGIAASDVVPGTGAIVNANYYAGEVVTAGMPVYRYATDGKLYKSLNDTVAHAACVGVAVNSAPKAGQPLAIVTSGPVTVGNKLTKAGVYCVSNTAGEVAPDADITAAEVKTIIGYAASATSLVVDITATGVAAS